MPLYWTADNPEWHARGRVFGQWLMRGSDRALAETLLVGLACAPMAHVRAALPDAEEALAGEPLFMLVDGARVTAIDPQLPELPAPPGWNEGEEAFTKAVVHRANQVGNALLVARLRFERLMQGSAEARAWFERDPAAFTEAFRAYHHAVPPRSAFPAEEAAAFHAHASNGGA